MFGKFVLGVTQFADFDRQAFAADTVAELATTLGQLCDAIGQLRWHVPVKLPVECEGPDFCPDDTLAKAGSVADPEQLALASSHGADFWRHDKIKSLVLQA